MCAGIIIRSPCQHLSVYTDSDFAGCVKSRKSTSGGIALLGSHAIKSWSTNQAVVALSSGEAEYYSIVKGASIALGLVNLMKDLGFEAMGPPVINSDASAAIGIVNRLGTGKVRHIEVCQLWAQYQVSQGKLRISKVGTKENLADALTKYVDAQTLQYHVCNTGGMCKTDRHPEAPRLDSMGSE